MVARYLVGFLGLMSLATAQVPDVRLKFDIGAYGRVDAQNHSQVRLYDTLGRPSFVSLTFYLESGLRAFASQRFEKLKGSGKTDFIDEFYVEDEGSWRVGKQYLPFGYGRLLAETAIGARVESNIVFDGIPVVFGFCDNGNGYQRGIVGRVGTPAANVFGAYGQHFGISGTSLATLRLPEDAPGQDHGYRILAGVETSRRIGVGMFTALVATFQDGVSAAEPSFVITDVSFTTRKINGRSGSIGFTYGSQPHDFVIRLAGSMGLDTRTDLEPMIRFSNGRFRDLTIGVRFRF